MIVSDAQWGQQQYLKTAMRVQMDQNHSIRQHLKKMSEHHMQQKSAFKKLFSSGIDISFQNPQVARLVCQGVPSVYRARVWPALIQNVHGITPKFYQLLIRKAAVMIEAEPNAVIPERARIITHLNRIENDIERTYPELKIFKKDNEQGQSLFNILTAWAVFRDDVGYIQGMSQIAGLLLIQLKQIDAFTLFCSILTTDTLFHYSNMSMQDIQFFEHNFQKRFKKGDEILYLQLKGMGIETRTYLLPWILTLFTRIMSLDLVSNLWDVLFVGAFREDLLMEVAFLTILTVKDKITVNTEPEEVHGILKNLKLTDMEASNVITKLIQFCR